MDDIIRDAVDKHHPAYNDKAWEKMEKKLDKHLPQKEGRRRFIFHRTVCTTRSTCIH